MTSTSKGLIAVFTLLLLTGNILAEVKTDQEFSASPVTSASQSLQQYQDTISKLESEQGAYHPALRQALFDLGQWYLAQGDYLKAVDAFEKALHVSKVNKGLHELSQVEIVELLIDSYSALQDWQGLDKNLHYLLWLHRRNYMAEDDRLVSTIERVAHWYMQAYQLYTGGEAVSYLVKADDLFDEAVNVIVKQHGENARQLINVLHSMATVNYHIANDVNDVFIMSHRDIREAMIPNKRPSPYMKEVAVREYYFNQSFYKGKRSLERVIAIYESELPASAIEYAQALVFQGDYYLALNRKWNAMKNYAKAYTVLLEHDASTEEILSIFGEPRQVEPFNIPGGEIADIDDSSYIDAVFDVPRSGWPKDIRIISTNPLDNAALSKRGKLAVAGIRYRPRFEDGKPVATERVSLRYIFRK
jgi:tetratricopeptide (TPR) repeat protein